MSLLIEKTEVNRFAKCLITNNSLAQEKQQNKTGEQLPNLPEKEKASAAELISCRRRTHEKTQQNKGC